MSELKQQRSTTSSPTEVEMDVQESKIGHNALQFAGPNPDPIPHSISSTEIKTPTEVGGVGPPPDGGREAYLVVLGGFLLMYVSFGFSKSSLFSRIQTPYI